MLDTGNDQNFSQINNYQNINLANFNLKLYFDDYTSKKNDVLKFY